MSTPHHKRLGKLVRARRADLRLSREAAALAGGPSAATIRRVEEAVSPRLSTHTLRKLDEVLEWTPGSASSVLAGNLPVERRDALHPTQQQGASLHAIVNDPMLSKHAKRSLVGAVIDEMRIWAEHQIDEEDDDSDASA